MGSNSGQSSSSPGLAAALLQFPAQTREVEGLFRLDDDFRGLCEDLADAQKALAACGQLPANVMEARRLEYEELVAGLSGEIEEILSRANVILLRPPRP